MMPLPKKITPDALLETYVEIHYASAMPQEVLFGKLYENLTRSFEYIRPPVQLLTGLLGGQVQAQAESLFRGHGIQIRLRDGFVGISCSGDYLGWERYRQQLANVLRHVYETGEISAFTRVGLRYINALPWKPANEQLLVQLPVMPIGLQLEQFRYQAQMRTDDHFRVNLMLSDDQRVAGREGPQSLFDLDIIWEHRPLQSPEDVIAKLDETHRREKEVFFGLLNPDYLASLNPEYE